MNKAPFSSLSIHRNAKLFPYSCYLEPYCQVLWLNTKRSPFSSDARTAEMEIKNCIYLAADQSMQTKHNELTELYAEMYGGFGGSFNGGGARCGLFGNIQLKGNGRNLLAGDKTPYSHSNGDLNLVDAVCDIIFSETLQQLMPVGTVACYSLVHLPDRHAFTYNEAQESAIENRVILLREPCVRPAHFMQPESFQISEVHRPLFLDTKYAHTQQLTTLSAELGGPIEFVREMTKFASAAAAQFAFALSSGICHGATTSSNLAIDGRWIDLSNATMTDNSKNYSVSNGFGSRPFSQEQHNVVDILSRFSWEFEKENDVNLQEKIIIDHYYSEFKRYQQVFNGSLIGLSISESFSLQDNPVYKILSDIVGYLIQPRGEIVYFSPSTRHRDSRRISVTKYLFHESLKSFGIQLLLEESPFFGTNSNQKAPILVRDIMQIVCCDSSRSESLISLKRRFFTSLRRTELSRIFYRGRIIDSLLYGISKARYQDQTVSNFINQHVLFNAGVIRGDYDSEHHVAIYKSSQASVHIDVASNKFVVRTKHDNRVYYTNSLKEFFYNKSLAILDSIIDLSTQNILIDFDNHIYPFQLSGDNFAY